jgi:hypothetical protein
MYVLSSRKSFNAEKQSNHTAPNIPTERDKQGDEEKEACKALYENADHAGLLVYWIGNFTCVTLRGDKWLVLCFLVHFY